MSDKCTQCGKPALEGLGLCADCANRFCAWIEGVCWHEWEPAIRTSFCSKCGVVTEQWFEDKEGNITVPSLAPPNYVHSADAMLDRVIPSTKHGVTVWRHDMVVSLGSDAFCKSVIRALLQTPLYDEWLKEMK